MAPFLHRFFSRTDRRRKAATDEKKGQVAEHVLEELHFGQEAAMSNEKKADKPLRRTQTLTVAMIRDIIHLDQASKSLPGSEDGDDKDIDVQVELSFTAGDTTGVVKEPEPGILDEGIQLLCQEGTVDSLINLLRSNSCELDRPARPSDLGLTRSLMRFSE